MEKDFYEILGITDEEKNLTGKDFEKIIKNKYKKLALKWHPDKFSTKSENERKEAENKFKDISEAYNTLSDENKRREYDMQNGGFDPFSDLNSFDPFDIFGHNRRNVQRKASNAFVKLELTLKELYNGVEKTFEYTRNVPCSSCNGTGSEDGKTEKCPHCQGTGFVSEVYRRGNFQTISRSQCRECGGTGVKITKPCKKCNGSGIETEKIVKTIKIEPYTLPGTRLGVQGGGDIVKDFIPGDLVIEISVSDTEKYTMLKNGDILETVEVPIFDALLGTEIDVEFLSGKKEKLKLKELTKDGYTYTFYNKGFKFESVGNMITSHIIKVKYVYPKKLTSKQRELIKKINKE